ncbi:hypothetical protein [Marinifilum fragile]|uniref:hypothetical protein n=1 Tax=Marinifilum fragile TaxID=570161 RepID=UPI002AAC3228|nr:hypothetical protein [Marinifilum fragile]
MNFKIKPYIILCSIILFALYILFGSNPKKKRLSYLESIRSTHLKGIIVDKYIDHNNHNYKIIKCRNFNNEEIVWFLNYDKSLFFEQVMIGDSIIKKQNSIKILIIRDDISKEYTLDFQTD